MASLEELKKRLYKEKETFGERMIPPRLARPRAAKSVFWREAVGEAGRNRWFFWMLAAILILVVLGAAFFIFGAPLFLKTQAIELKIEGAEDIKSGDRITWQVRVTNKSGGQIDDAVLVFNFPDGATPVSGSKPEGVFRERRALGQIRPGEGALENFDAYVFGGKGQTRDVSAVLEYRPAGGSSIFAADAIFQFSIVRSPVVVSFKIPEELRIGQQTELEIDYGSQSEETIANLSLQVLLPDGFEYASASPSPTAQNKNIWSVGDLSPAQSGKITIRGTIRGSNLESKTFRAALGVFDQNKKSFLAYDEVAQPVTLRAPFLEVAVSANGRDKYVSFPGDTINFRFKIRNNLPVEIKNATLEVKMEGVEGILDFSTLLVERGSYSETSKSIVWNASNSDTLKILTPNAEDEAAFSIKLKNIIALSGNSPRPAIKITANFKPGGSVPGFEGVDVSGSSVYEIKISSKLQVVSRGLFANSAIPNSGPLPPKVGRETTYTVIWSLANMANDADSVVVKSSLPPYANFKNVVSPADVNIAFDKTSGEIIWRAGRVLAGTGFLRPAMEVAFQIGFTPSEDQINEAPILINATVADGRDTFTDQSLTSEDGQITIEIPDDPSVGFNQKRVVP